MKILQTIAGILLSTAALAQVNPQNWCGQHKAHNEILNSRPEARQEVEQATYELEEFTKSYSAERSGEDDIYTVPVVVHVIHNNGPENISDEQIRNAIDIMTRDYRKQNADISVVVPEFQSITADCGIEFKLAGKDPDGNCHSGINRVVSQLTYNGGSNQLKNLIRWPRDKYLNIWVVNDAGGAAGFSNYPSSVNSMWDAYLDGIVVRYDYVGNTGASSEVRSRTLTHEAGHWLNLRHTWGDSNDPGDPNNCFEDDLVADTPNTIGHLECSLAASTCDETLDNVQNYMEYSYCSRMFTQGQRQRMRAALNSSIAQRNNLITQANLIATGVVNPPLCGAFFDSDNKTSCVGEDVQFHDLSYHGVTSWTWNFGDGTTLSGTDASQYKDPVHQYSQPGSYSVTLTVSNGTVSKTTTIDNYISVQQTGVISQNFHEGFEGEWPNSYFTIDNQDQGLTFEVTPTAAYSGSKSLKLRNYGNTIGSNRDVLYTATFDLRNATNAQLSYKWAYTNKLTSSNDQLIISYSGDCGTTWDIRRMREGQSNLMTAAPTSSQFTPANTDQWNGESLSIGFDNWLTDRFQARFEFVGKGGNNFYLDDINLTADFGVGVEEVKPIHTLGVYPNPSAGDMTLDFALPASEEVSILMYNSTGQLCQMVHNGHLSSGSHRFTLNRQAAGLYSVIVKQGDRLSVHKVIFE